MRAKRYSNRIVNYGDRGNAKKNSGYLSCADTSTLLGCQTVISLVTTLMDMAADF